MLVQCTLPSEFKAANSGDDQLEENFKNPPASARPRTWMHVMSGNMSKEGLTKDIQAMHDAGIGGLILFNITHFIPKGKVKFNSAEHIDMTAHAAAECERLGMSFGVHNCDGWRNSGGPWVTPEHSMKQVVHTEITIDGGTIDLQLPQPATRKGYYEDVAVVAYPALASELDDATIKPVITSSDPNCDTDLVNDGKADVITKLGGTVDEKAWIQFDYGQPKTIRSVYINLNKKIADKGRTWLLTSNDGKNFETARELKILRMGKMENGFDDVFAPITARYFRVETEVDFDLMEMDLSNTQRLENMLARTSLFQREDAQIKALKQPDQSMIIKKEDLLDLSANVDATGKLNAQLPAGKWTIMRFGYTSTGATNGPASREGTGLEADKMSKASFKVFYEGYVRNVINATKKVAPNALQYIEIDSYEVGGQNWTQGYEDYFQEKYGYDLVKFLPLYAGRFIESAEVSDDVLWDLRKLNSDLIAENYFGYFNELCHEDGLIGYAEPYSFNGPFNELDAGGQVDVPMGEFWMHQRYQTETAVSSARIYGKPIISAEAFSAQPNINWKSHPGYMKLSGDIAWTLGINEFMFHRYAHQANTHVKPGMTMSQWGSHIDRTQTWWDNAGKAWFKYLARGQYMLRQGIPVSDLLIFVGDGAPNSVVKRTSFNPAIPHKINFDCINADALINRISTENEKMVLPEGLQYKALVLYNTKNISLSVLQKVNELAEQGIVIIGKKPAGIGGYNYSDTDQENFDQLVRNIWSKPTTYSENQWETIFQTHNFPVDLNIENGEGINYIHRTTPTKDIYFFYNPDSTQQSYLCTFNVDGKIPELWNPMTGEVTKLAAFEHLNGQTKTLIPLPGQGSTFVLFREASKNVKSIAPQSAIQHQNLKFALSQNKLPILEAFKNGSYEIAFTDGTTQQQTIADLPTSITLANTWEVTFSDLKATPKTVTFPKLIDWTSHENEAIKYYSGTANYTTSFKVEKGTLSPDRKFMLDLGTVSIAARVILNGQDLGVVWMSPHKVDISSVLKAGENQLSIEVTNQWTNRLIGDENYPNEAGFAREMENMPEWYTNNEPAPLQQRSTFTAFPFYKKGDDLLSAGLVGPVKIQPAQVISLIK
ncbi:MAG: hypothetical protein Sapg2KO_23650 [Saprospiraceae bacterium]